jgi:hypothetical protein
LPAVELGGRWPMMLSGYDASTWHTRPGPPTG